MRPCFPFRYLLGFLVLLAAASNLLAGDGVPFRPDKSLRAILQDPGSTWRLDVQEVLNGGESRLAALEEELRFAHDEEHALSLQREIERLKLETEIRLLEVQADHARCHGRTALVLEIEAAMENLSTMLESGHADPGHSPIIRSSSDRRKR